MRVNRPPPPVPEVRRQADRLLDSLNPSGPSTPVDQFAVSDATFARFTQAPAAVEQDPLLASLANPDQNPAALAAEELIDRFSQTDALGRQVPNLEAIGERLQLFANQPGAILERCVLLRAVLTALARRNRSYAERTARHLRDALHREVVAPIEAVLSSFAGGEASLAQEAVEDELFRVHSAPDEPKERAAQVMTVEVITVSGETSIRKAQQLMQRLDIRHLVVTQGGRLSGVLSERDILLRSQLGPAGDVTLPEGPVKAAMSKQPVTCLTSTPIWEVAELMLANRFDCLPVVDAKDELRGLITSTDLIRLVASGRQEPQVNFHFTDADELDR